MIGRSEVFKLAQRFGVGEWIIEKDYVLSWVLIGIAESDLGKHMAFKGGTALKRIYFPEYRFSEDLDYAARRLGSRRASGVSHRFAPAIVEEGQPAS